MSSHFELAVNCFIKEDVPSSVIEFLRWLAARPPRDVTYPVVTEGVPKDVREALDVEDGWTFPGPMFVTFAHKYLYEVRQQPVYKYTLGLRCHIHDDALGEAFEFLDWLAGVAESSGFVGFYRQEFSAKPTLIYFVNGTLQFQEVEN